MPVRLISYAGSTRGLNIPATEADKVLIIKANSNPPGIRGLLKIPTDPVYTAAILLINVFSYGCVLFDFTVALRKTNYYKVMIPLQEGSFRQFIFCTDFIIVIDTFLGICHRKAKMIHSRSIFIIIIDFFTIIPYEMVYVVLKGSDIRVYFGLRLRYILRLLRYVMESQRSNRFKLSVTYVMMVYLLVMSILCMMIVCIRLKIFCLGDYPNNTIINCNNLTLFDIALTYAILNSQLSYSGMIFINDPYTAINYIDNLLQMIVSVTTYIVISRMICILLENNQYRINFCLAAHCAIQALRAKKRNFLKFSVDRKLDFLRKYMASNWKHYQIEKIQTTYTSNYKAATVPNVIYSQITLDLSWNMFKHSILFQKESVAFLRQLSKLTVFAFGTKNDIICQQGKFRYSMIYIIKGVFSVMNQNSGTKPLISFSAGTILGELALFLNVPSPTTIYCNTYCEYMVLSQINFQKIRAIYPKIYDRLRKKCLKRVAYAKNYDYIAKEMYENGDIPLPKSMISLRYIKSVLRFYMDTPNPPLKQSLFMPDYMIHDTLFTNVIFNARFIPLYVEADQFESNLQTHFAVSGCNFKLKASSTLYHIWRFTIAVIVLVDCLFFPVGALQDIELYSIFYDYFVIGVTVFYILDFLSYNFISVTYLDVLLIDSEAMLMHNVEKMEFWCDLIACVPIEIILNLMQSKLDPNVYRLLGLNRIIKIYRVLVYLNKKLVFSKALILLISILKSIYGIILLVLYGYLIFHRFGYFELCSIALEGKEMSVWMKLTIIYQFLFSMGEIGMKVNRDVNFIPMIILQIIAIYIFTFILCINAASFALVYLPTINYENLTDDVKRIFVLFKFPHGAKKKLTKYLKVWYSHKEPMDKNSYFKVMGKALYKEYCSQDYFDQISNLKLFDGMPTSVLNNFCEIAEIQIIPRGELIVIAGSLAKYIYFLMDGRCEHTLRDGTGTIKPLRIGDAILLFEAFLGLNALSNVMAITDCKLLCFSVSNLRRKLVKFPVEMKIIIDSIYSIVDKKKLGYLQTYQPRALPDVDETESCRYFLTRDLQYLDDFGIFRPLAVLFMHQTITPFGRFWFVWEIVHICVAFANSFICTIPITVSCDVTDLWFWLFRVMDIFFLIDMYLRHHLIYFNSYNIEVQHPWFCAIHYWKTNFLLELIAIIPLELIVLPVLKNINIFEICLLRLNKHLRLLRFRGLQKFINFKHMKTFKFIIILTYSALLLLIFNFLIAFLFSGDVQIQNCKITFYVVDMPSFWSAYVSMLCLAIRQLCSIGISEGFTHSARLYLYAILNAAGQSIYVSMMCIIIAMGLSRKTYLMTFQIKMYRLVMFMNLRKIDKKIRNEIIKHYEYLWKLREGKELSEILQTFTKGVAEEVTYSYYAPTLQQTLLFTDYPKVIMKDILSSRFTRSEMFLITGIVIRVNDIQNKLYIVYKGQVQVLGPDFNYLRDLHVGSIFGCLDNVANHRSTLTYVAKTHCEFISIPAIHYHNIMSKYPRYYKLYLRMLKSSNCDYISGGKSTSTALVRSHQRHQCREVLRDHTISHYLKKRVKKVFPVIKPCKYLTIFFVIYMVIAFQFECMLLTFLYKYFNVVVYIAYALDLIFWFKIYIDFSTEYENSYGYIISNRRQIAIKYFKELFGAVFHLLAIFPFEMCCMLLPIASYYHLWAYLRCNRLLKIILVFRYTHSVRNRLNINVGLIKSFDIILSIYTTEQIAIIFLSPYLQEFYPYIDAFIFHSYLISKRIYTPFLNELPEFTNANWYKIVYVFILLATQLICVLVISDCVATYQMLNYSRFCYETFLKDQEHVMQILKVSSPLFTRIKAYYRNLIHHGLNVQFPLFLIDAPYYLREGVLDAMFGFHLRKHPVFKLCHSDFNRQVAATFKTLYFFEGDIIVFQGDIDTNMYFIHIGEVEGLVEDNIYYDIADSKYCAGDYFGFHQLVYTNVGHAKTYKVVSKMAMVIAVKRQHILRLLEFFPASKFLFCDKDLPNDDLETAEVEYRDYLKHTRGVHE